MKTSTLKIAAAHAQGTAAHMIVSVLALACLAAVEPGAQEAGPQLSGSIGAVAAAGLEEGLPGGYSTELRLVLQDSPERGFRFRAEGGYIRRYGILSPLAEAVDQGLAAKPPEEALPPGQDLHREFFLDQAYAAAELGALELRAGIVPIAWGSAYLHNPSARVSAAKFPGEELDRIQGKPGAAVAVALPAGFSLEGYALAAARRSAVVPTLEELDYNRIPAGAKAQYRGDYLDLSAGIIRELPGPGEENRDWALLDAAGYLGQVNWYAESAFRLDGPPKEGEFSGGLSYTLPVLEAELRTEFIYLGAGAAKPEDYDAAALLAGKTLLLGRRYLFASLEKEDPQAARWKLTGGGLLNLEDLSAALLAEALWRPGALFELGLFVRAFSSPRSSEGEFGGERTLGPDAAFRPYRNVLGLSAKWVF